MILELGPYKVDVDTARTREFYRNAPRIDQKCGCDGCRNYARAADVFPEAVLTFFSLLGVDPKKPPEIWVNDPDRDGLLLYHGFYHVCGTILSGGSAFRSVGGGRVWDRDLAFRVAPGFCVSFEEGSDLLEGGFPQPAVQMEIDAETPWALEKDIHDISFDWR